MMRSNEHILCRWIALGITLIITAAGSAGSPAAAARADAHNDVAGGAVPTAAALNNKYEQVLSAYAKLPVAFVENRGQIDSRVQYYAQGNGYAFYLTREEVMLSLA